MFTIETQKDAIDFINSLQSFLESNNSTVIVGLFGSYARNDFSSESDIDIVYKNEAQGVLDDFLLIDDYCERNLVLKHDIVSLEDAERHDNEMIEFSKQMGLPILQGIAEGIEKDVIWSEKVLKS